MIFVRAFVYRYTYVNTRPRNNNLPGLYFIPDSLFGNRFTLFAHDTVRLTVIRIGKGYGRYYETTERISLRAVNRIAERIARTYYRRMRTDVNINNETTGSRALTIHFIRWERKLMTRGATISPSHPYLFIFTQQYLAHETNVYNRHDCTE